MTKARLINGAYRFLTISLVCGSLLFLVFSHMRTFILVKAYFSELFYLASSSFFFLFLIKKSSKILSHYSSALLCFTAVFLLKPSYFFGFETIFLFLFVHIFFQVVGKIIFERTYEIKLLLYFFCDSFLFSFLLSSFFYLFLLSINLHRFCVNEYLAIFKLIFGLGIIWLIYFIIQMIRKKHLKQETEPQLHIWILVVLLAYCTTLLFTSSNGVNSIIFYTIMQGICLNYPLLSKV